MNMFYFELPSNHGLQSCSCYPASDTHLDPVIDRLPLWLCFQILWLFMFTGCLHYRPQPLLLTTLLPSESVPHCPLVADFWLFLTRILFRLWCTSNWLSFNQVWNLTPIFNWSWTLHDASPAALLLVRYQRSLLTVSTPWHLCLSISPAYRFSMSRCAQKGNVQEATLVISGSAYRYMTPPHITSESPLHHNPYLCPPPLTSQSTSESP